LKLPRFEFVSVGDITTDPDMPSTRSRLRRLAPLAWIPALAVTASLLTDRIGYDPAPYLQDLHTLEDSAAAGYANLDWQVPLPGLR
jgi:hypothetical protein